MSVGKSTFYLYQFAEPKINESSFQLIRDFLNSNYVRIVDLVLWSFSGDSPSEVTDSHKMQGHDCIEEYRVTSSRCSNPGV